MAQFQNLDLYSGENVTLTLYARDPSNNVQNLAISTVIWRVGKPPNMPDQKSAVIEKDGTIVDAAGGIYTVQINPSDLWGQDGNFTHVGLAIVDGSLTFQNNALQDLEFTNDAGDEIVFVNNLAGTFVVTSGILRVRSSIQV